MSDASVLTDELQEHPRTTVPATVQVPAMGASVIWARFSLAVALVLAVVALFAILLLWQKVNGMREQLAHQSADAMAQSMEARTLSRQAQELVRDAAARVALNETRVNELVLQRAQVEEIVQALSRTRDESLVIDVESGIRQALLQAQVTGDAQPLLAALKASEIRIARAAQPRLAPLQRAIQRDAERLRMTASVDNADALQKLDDLIRTVDDLPPLNAIATKGLGLGSVQPDPVPMEAAWWERFLVLVRAEARSLLRVGRIDRPEAVLLAPDQIFFLRENLKLRLLNARLSLLSRQIDGARSELAAVNSALNRYFDPSSRRVQAAATLLQQLQGLVRSTEAPRIEETLAALTTAAAGR